MQKDNDKGFALLEILGGLVVISLLMPLFWSYIEDYLNEMRNQSAAFHADALAVLPTKYLHRPDRQQLVIDKSIHIQCIIRNITVLIQRLNPVILRQLHIQLSENVQMNRCSYILQTPAARNYRIQLHLSADLQHLVSRIADAKGKRCLSHNRKRAKS